MAIIRLYGFEAPSYVRTARIALEEKGVDYEMAPLKLGSPDHLALHPFAKMPILQHGYLVLTETAAIVRYVNEAFEGPDLEPDDLVERARMTEWISTVVDYIYPTLIRRLLTQRIFVPSRGGTTDEAVVADALQDMARQFDLIERTLADRPFLAGQSFSPADMFLAPILISIPRVEDAARALSRNPATNAWLDGLKARPSFVAVHPKPDRAAS